MVRRYNRLLAVAYLLTDATAEDMASPLSVLRMVMSFLRGRANGRPILVIVVVAW